MDPLNSRGGGAFAGHEDWIGKAKRREEKEGDRDEERFPESEGIEADEYHSKYGFYSNACATPSGGPRAAI